MNFKLSNDVFLKILSVKHTFRIVLSAKIRNYENESKTKIKITSALKNNF